MAMDLPFEGEKGPETRAGAVADRAIATCGLDDAIGEVAGRGEICVVVVDGVVMSVRSRSCSSRYPANSSFGIDGRLVGAVRRVDLDP